jgi:hypothetical protein
MITLRTDCLLFELANGESVPFSAEMISVELSGDGVGKFEPQFVQHAANAVFHYFKHDLGRLTVTVGEFAGALEKVLRGFGLCAQLPDDGSTPPTPRVLESDLRELACDCGKGFELFFFPKLRDELRVKLKHSPQILHFRGLRSCVKKLTGARRWCPRCQTLHEQIVEYLRNCFSAETNQGNCALLVE